MLIHFDTFLQPVTIEKRFENCGFLTIDLKGGIVRPYYLRKRFKYDNEIPPKGPILDVSDVTLDPFQNFTISASLTPVTAHLRDSRYPWLNKSPDSVGGHYFLKSPIVHNHVGSWTHHTHLSPEDVNKLRYLIQTRPSQPATEVVHALVISRCLPRGPIVCRTHRTKLDDSEWLATSARARLQEKERSRGLASLD
jgi:hypothetical protein